MDDEYTVQMRAALLPLAARIALGQSAHEVLLWAYANERTLLPAFFSKLPQSQRKPMAFRLVAEAAQVINVPSNGWKAQPLIMRDPQARCACGSGAKFRNCCGKVAPLESDALLPWYAYAMPAWLDIVGAAGLPYAKLDVKQLAQTAVTEADVDPDATVTWLLPLLHASQNAILAPLSDDEAGDLVFAAADAMSGAKIGQVEALAFTNSLLTHPRAAVVASATVFILDSRVVLGESLKQITPDLAAARARFPGDFRFDNVELIALLTNPETAQSDARKAMLVARLKRDAPELLERTLAHFDDDDAPSAVIMGWNKMLNRISPDEIKAMAQLYSVETSQDADGQFVGQLQTPSKIKKLDRQWAQKFDLLAPILTELDADAEFDEDTFDAMFDFVSENHDALGSFVILDQLMLYAMSSDDDDQLAAHLDLLAALGEIAFHMAQSLPRDVSTLLPWMNPAHRPLLRCLAQYVEVLFDERDEIAVAVMEWVLSVNPQDNHGFRDTCSTMFLQSENSQKALALGERYPNDTGECGYNFVLALFIFDRKEQAAIVWNRLIAGPGAQIATMLLADKAPKVNVQLGFTEDRVAVNYANRYRENMREFWQDVGALAWARLQAAPASTPKPKPTKSGTKMAAKASQPPGLAPSGKRGTLIAQFGQSASRVHGYLTAVAWSARLIMPSQWLNPALEMIPGGAQMSQKAFTDFANGLMNAYNSANDAVMAARTRKHADVDWALPSFDYDAVDWAAGFIRATSFESASWNKRAQLATMQSSASEKPLERIRQLAAFANLAREDSERVLDQNARPLLQAVGQAGQMNTKEVLQKNLLLLWGAVGKESRH